MADPALKVPVPIGATLVNVEKEINGFCLVEWELEEKTGDAWIPEEEKKKMKKEKEENTRPWRQWAQRKHNVAFKRKWKWTDQLQNHISWWQKGTRIRNKSEEPLVNWKDSKVFKDTEQKEQSSDEALVIRGLPEDNVD